MRLCLVSSQGTHVLFLPLSFETLSPPGKVESLGDGVGIIDARVLRAMTLGPGRKTNYLATVSIRDACP